MSASNKSWLMVGGLCLLVAAVVYGTRRINQGPAPTAEIAPTTLTTEPNETRTRTHVPTILRAKPITNGGPAASPRYAPRNSTDPSQAGQIGSGPSDSGSAQPSLSGPSSQPVFDNPSPGNDPAYFRTAPGRATERFGNGSPAFAPRQPATDIPASEQPAAQQPAAR